MSETAPGAARHRAEAQQRQASDPTVSAFVAASAGSGKTKLLTDRLLRLMLDGAEPARIQCLTYTKAAAAEMALRLQRRLGRWVAMDDAALAAELTALAVEPDATKRTRARALFADVLDLPGGMRIGTIHAFCQSLLRRFPLEAQVSPHFEVVDESDAALARGAAQEAALAKAARTRAEQERLRRLAGLISFDQFSDLILGLLAVAERMDGALAGGPEALLAALRQALGALQDEATLAAACATWAEEAAVAAALRVLAEQGNKTGTEAAAALAAWLALPPDQRTARFADWHACLHTKDGNPRALARWFGKALCEARPELVEVLAAEQARADAIMAQQRAALTAELSASLACLAGPILRGYAHAKESIARLDYDDLVARTERLLDDPGAAWVLYKLDGGLDHLLLDEVQDTAPAQWRIARKLTEEFFAGAGARDGTNRTVFAVGDAKQSIFAFQGARPDEFARGEAAFRAQVESGGRRWESVTLDVSFRSTAPVLALVDAVFTDPEAASGVVAPGATLRHHADRAGHAGRVELWPLVPVPEPVPVDGWTIPDSNERQQSAEYRLAGALAAWIAAQTAGAVPLESRGRPLHPGDVLVLVRRRTGFGRALVRELKSLGVPVAGLDRLALTEQPAVADLLSLADVLLLPQDDLSLACVLTSPLGGLSPQSLEDLAALREGPLWAALRARHGSRADWAEAWHFLATLFARADHVTPHALFAEALGPLGGRAKLLARLGPEAAEPIDELLNATLAHAALHPPSLQGFLHWLRAANTEVKREPDAAGGAVRVMTVHGAKGLQAPLVILPDTTGLPPDGKEVLWTDGTPPLPVWVPHKEFGCTAADALADAARRRRAEEYNRLLYVALTRAEDRLIVCGWQTAKKLPDACWYGLVERGFARLGGTVARAPFAAVTDPWPGEHLTLAEAQSRPAEPDRASGAAEPVTLPAWVSRPPPEEPAPPVPLAPSRPPDIELGARPGADAPLTERDATGTRFRRGQLTHALLQHLPALPPQDRAAAARRFLDRPGHGLTEAALAAIAADVLAVLDHPELAPLFGPDGRAEVPLSGVVGGRVVGGLVDRLAVLPGRVLVADFKTNRAPPRDLDAVPVFYLRQMAAYRAVLQAIHPERMVACALVWTADARVMPLPGATLDRYAPGAPLTA